MYRKDNQIFIKVEAYSGENRMLRVLIVGLAAAVFAYTYFVGVSIMNVIHHKEAIAESDRLQRAVGLLEQDYFKLSNTMTPARGAEFGLIPASDTSFVRRPGAVGVAGRENSI